MILFPIPGGCKKILKWNHQSLVVCMWYPALKKLIKIDRSLPH